MSVVPAPSAGRIDSVLRVAAVALAWLAVVLATAIVCRPLPGTELSAPAVVAVAALVVVAVGRPVGGTLALFNMTLLATTVWGEVGGAVLVVSTVVAVTLLPVHAVRPGPRRGRS
ncbi:hypothetical protein AB0I81_29705 [Nonomuraea sp. NPDC050404]|uniref:hypothetical protein n=1 Tax=Nonomuraea sp. NPDC050404 TaxID=3155783 RepID=UPI0033EE04C6